MGNSNGDGTTHRGRLDPVVAAVRRRYGGDIFLCNSTLFLFSIHSCMNSGLSGSLAACALLEKALERQVNYRNEGHA